MSDTSIEPPSTMRDADWDKHAHPKADTPYKRPEGTEPPIDVGDGHKLWAQEFGNKHGEPVIVLHGGPGAGCDGVYVRYFDPKRYHIILFDQRGCLNSTPTTHDNFDAAMKNNDTSHLVEDINTVRKHFGINGKMHIEGGSWGSTLALAYAIKHPQNVKSLILRGVFLENKGGAEFMFQGNAATYNEAPQPLTDQSTPEEIKAFLDHYDKQDHRAEGSYRAFMGDGKTKLDGQIDPKYWPTLQHMREAYAKAWDEYVRIIPKDERGNMNDAYLRRVEAKPDLRKKGSGTYDSKAKTIDADYQQRCAFAYAQWEGLISQFSQEVGKDGKIDLDKFSDPNFALDFTRIEARYHRDGCYLSPNGKAVHGGGDYIVNNVGKIVKHKIPIFVAHGQDDQVCPIRDAYDLQKAYEASVKKIHGKAALEEDWAKVYIDARPKTGHTMTEKGNTLALIDILDHRVPHMTPAEIEGGGPKGPLDHAKRGGSDDLPPH